MSPVRFETIFKMAWSSLDSQGFCDGEGASQYRRCFDAASRDPWLQSNPLHLSVESWVRGWVVNDDTAPSALNTSDDPESGIDLGKTDLCQ